MTKQIKRGLLAAGVLVATGAAHAAGPDFSAITGAVELDTVAAAILAIAAVLALPAVVKLGARKVLGMIGR